MLRLIPIGLVCRVIDTGCAVDHRFASLAHARVLIERWRREYYEERPKQILGGLTPAQYAKQLERKQLQLLPDFKALRY